MSDEITTEASRVIGDVRSVIAAYERAEMTRYDLTMLLARIDNVVTHRASAEAWHRVEYQLRDMLHGLDQRLTRRAKRHVAPEHFGCLGRLRSLVGQYYVVGATREMSGDESETGVMLDERAGSAATARRDLLIGLLEAIRVDDDLSGATALMVHDPNNSEILNRIMDSNGRLITKNTPRTGSSCVGASLPVRGTSFRESLDMVGHLTLGLFSKDTDAGAPPDNAVVYRPIKYVGILLEPPPDDMVAYLAQEFAALHGHTLVSAKLLDVGPVMTSPEDMAVLWRLEPPKLAVYHGARYIITPGPSSRRELIAECAAYHVRMVEIGRAVAGVGEWDVLAQITLEDEGGRIRKEDIAIMTEV